MVLSELHHPSSMELCASLGAAATGSSTRTNGPFARCHSVQAGSRGAARNFRSSPAEFRAGSDVRCSQAAPHVFPPSDSSPQPPPTLRTLPLHQLFLLGCAQRSDQQSWTASFDQQLQLPMHSAPRPSPLPPFSRLPKQWPSSAASLVLTSMLNSQSPS